MMYLVLVNVNLWFSLMLVVKLNRSSEIRNEYGVKGEWCLVLRLGLMMLKMLGISNGIPDGKMGIFRRKIQIPTEITTDKRQSELARRRLHSNGVQRNFRRNCPSKIPSAGCQGLQNCGRKFLKKNLNFEKKIPTEFPTDFFCLKKKKEKNSITWI